jgi:uncharacterized protein YbjT (DUF2867 family)
MKIAVAGGTGLIGRLVVDAARQADHQVVILTRSHGVDLVTGKGLATALTGLDAVIDVANVTTMSASTSSEFFTTTSRHLLEAERAAGVRHHVALSIVGVDRAPAGYYAGKRAQEKCVESGSQPWTILRATQFHEFAAQMYERFQLGPIHLAPRMRTQPVAAAEVAEHLVVLAAAEPVGYTRDLGGPREESLVDMIRRYAQACGSKAWIPAISVPGTLGRAQRDGTLLPGPDAQRGRRTFDDWLCTPR